MKTKYPVYFISGIDTDIGKTFVTGLMIKYLKSKNINVITQKPVETGNSGKISEDIKQHRKIAGMPLSEFDKNGTTCSYLFKFPASPHLSAKLENIEIDKDIIQNASCKLSENFDTLLIEGAGGLYVPLNNNLLTINYIKENNYPLILVTSDRLGSINHTLMSLDLCKIKGINLIGLIFNISEKSEKIISEDSKVIFKEYLNENFPKAVFAEVPFMKSVSNYMDFETVFL